MELVELMSPFHLVNHFGWTGTEKCCRGYGAQPSTTSWKTGISPTSLTAVDLTGACPQIQGTTPGRGYILSYWSARMQGCKYPAHSSV